MNRHRWNVTAPDGRTISIVAKGAASAREKGIHRLNAGLPFQGYGRDELKLTRLERVDGPPMINI